MFRTLWRYLKLCIHFNRRLRGIFGAIRVVDDGFILLRWNFRLFQALEAFCRSMPASRQEPLRAESEAVLAQRKGELRAALDLDPAFKRTLGKTAALIDADQEAKVSLERALTTHLTEDELLFLSKDQIPKRVSWNEVREIAAYQVDLFAYIDVRLGFVRQDGSGVEVGGSMLGWRELEAEMLRRFPMIDPNWEAKVVHPPLEQNWTQLWPVV